MCPKTEIYLIGLGHLYCCKWKKIQSSDVTLTLTFIGQCPMSNSSELFSYTTTQTHTQTHTETYGKESSIDTEDNLNHNKGQ